jgi:Mce-associated membrane protein
MTTPTRAGWYADPLKPETQERRWDGAEWTDETREASVRDSGAVVLEKVPPSPAQDPAVGPALDPAPEPESPAEPEAYVDADDDEAVDDDEAPAPPRTGATIVLVAGIVVLVAVLLLQVAYLWGPLADDPKVSQERPVLLSRAAERSAVDTAAQAAVAFSERDFSTYDEQVDKATAMMTEGFAEEFRQTTEDAKDRWVEGEVKVTAEVAAQAVMTASDRQVEVLIFLNQFTTRAGEESTFTPFRLKVTLIDTEQGWLVSDVDAT